MDEMERKIDLAISSYPLRPLPAGFTRRVMRRIQPVRPAFRLSYLDWLLPGFMGIFGMSIVGAVLLTLPLLDPLWLPRLKLAWQVVLLRLALLPDIQPLLLYAGAFAGVGVLVGLGLAGLTPARRLVRVG